MSVHWSSLLVALFGFCTGVVLVALTEPRRAERTRQVWLFSAAFALRFLVSVGLYEFGLTHFTGDEDSSGWVGGIELQQHWQETGVTLLGLPLRYADAYASNKHLGYLYLVGMLFYVTDSPYRLTAAAVNCFAGSMVVVLAYRISRSLFSEWVATRVGWLTCLWPSLVLWSAMTIKEAVVMLLELWAAACCIRIVRGTGGFSALLAAAAATVLLIPMRFYAAYVTGLGITVAVGSLLLQRSGMRVSAGAQVVLLGGLLVTPVLATWYGEEAGRALDRAQSFRGAVAGGDGEGGTGSGVETVDVRTSYGLVLGTGIGFAHLMLAPFPWQLGGSTRVVATLPELLVWWYLLFWGVIPGLRRAVANGGAELTVIFVFLAGFTLIASLMFGNVGLIFRQRATLLPLLFNFAILGLQRRSQPRVVAHPARERLITPTRISNP